MLCFENVDSFLFSLMQQISENTAQTTTALEEGRINEQDYSKVHEGKFMFLTREQCHYVLKTI